MTENRSVCTNVCPYSGTISLGIDRTVKAPHNGKVKLIALLPDNSNIPITLHESLYALELKCSLISWDIMKFKGITMKGSDDITFWKDGYAPINYAAAAKNSKCICEIVVAKFLKKYIQM